MTRAVRQLLLVIFCSAPLTAFAQESGRILVMPFENVSRDPRIVWLSEAASVLLADDLNALGARAIAREERRIAFDRLRVPPAADLSDATVIRIGELLGASEIITGTLLLQDESLVIDARRITLDVGRADALPQQRAPVQDLFDVFERLARLAAGTSRALDATELERPPVAAFENYIKGLVAETPATATGYLNAALAADPTFVAPRLALWDVYTARGEHERALAAVRLVPDNSARGRRARFLAGLSHLDLERYEDAVVTFEALAGAQPSASVLNNLGVARLRRSEGARPHDSAQEFRRATEADNNQADSFFNLGYASWLGKDLKGALYWLREAVRRNPTDGDAHYLLGVALEASGSPSEGLRERELAKRLSATYEDWERELGRSSVPDELERVRHDIELPGARWVEEMLTAAGQRGQRELATFHLERARRHFEARRDREAVDDLNRSLFLDPYQGEAHLLVARIHLRGGRPGEAIDALKVALWSAETAEAHALLAQAFLENGDEGEARRSAERAVKLDPGSVTGREVLRRLGGEATSPP